MCYFQVLKFDNRQSEETLKNTYGQIGHCCYGETHRSDHCFSYISVLICPLFMGLLTVVETQTTRSWSSILVPCKVGPRTKSSWCFRWKLDSSRASIFMLWFIIKGTMRLIQCEIVCILQLLCLVGESFDEASEDVCGAVVNVRPKGDKIAIWTSNCQNRDAIMTIG